MTPHEIVGITIGAAFGLFIGELFVLTSHTRRIAEALEKLNRKAEGK